jgi:hypothetical protein
VMLTRTLTLRKNPGAADTLHLPTAMQSAMLRATMIHSNVVDHACKNAFSCTAR